MGDVIQLQSRTDQTLPLFVNNKHMFDTIVGVHKKRYAARILSQVPEEKKYGEK